MVAEELEGEADQDRRQVVSHGRYVAFQMAEVAIRSHHQRQHTHGSFFLPKDFLEFKQESRLCSRDFLRGLFRPMICSN